MNMPNTITVYSASWWFCVERPDFWQGKICCTHRIHGKKKKKKKQNTGKRPRTVWEVRSKCRWKNHKQGQTSWMQQQDLRYRHRLTKRTSQDRHATTSYERPRRSFYGFIDCLSSSNCSGMQYVLCAMHPLQTWTSESIQKQKLPVCTRANNQRIQAWVQSICKILLQGLQEDFKRISTRSSHKDLHEIMLRHLERQELFKSSHGLVKGIKRPRPKSECHGPKEKLTR